MNCLTSLSAALTPMITAARIAALESALLGAKNIGGIAEQAMYYKDTVFAAMNELRAAGDELEVSVSRKFWPYPTYGELLFSVR